MSAPTSITGLESQEKIKWFSLLTCQAVFGRAADRAQHRYPKRCKDQAEALHVHLQVLNVRLVFDEAAVLRENQEYLQRTLDLQSIAVHMTTDDAAQQHDLAEKLNAAEPGKPLVVLSTELPQQRNQTANGSAEQHIAKLAVNGSPRT